MPRQDRQSGFTLIELMVTIAVLAILLSIGIPSFAETIRNNRVASQTNEFLTALNLARSEATKRGLPVTICGAADADLDSCSGTTDWSNGWVIFADPANPGVVNAPGEVVIQTYPALNGQLQLTTPSVSTFVRFAASGNAGANISFNFRHQTCTGNNLRQIGLSPVGRISMQKVPCP